MNTQGKIYSPLCRLPFLLVSVSLADWKYNLLIESTELISVVGLLLGPKKNFLAFAKSLTLFRLNTYQIK